MDVRGAAGTSRAQRATQAAAVAVLLCLPLVAVAQDIAGPMAASENGVVAAADRRLPVQETMPLGAAKGRTLGEKEPIAKPASSASHMLQTVLVLGVVIGAIVLVGAGVRKLARAKGGLLAELGAGGKAPAGVLEVLGRYPISRGSMLVLLKLDRRILLTCQTQGRRGGGMGMSTLCEITDPEEVASILLKTREEEGDSLAKRFEAMLGKEDAWPALDEGGIEAPVAQPRLVSVEENVRESEPLEVVVRAKQDRPLAQRHLDCEHAWTRSVLAASLGKGGARVRNIATLMLIVMSLVVMFGGGVARGIDTLGPPMPTPGNGASGFPGSNEGRLESALTDRLDSMNPMGILSNVGEVLTRRSGGDVGTNSSSTDPSKQSGLSTSVNILVVLTIVSLAPSIVLMCTCFIRILIVLGFLRQALGTSSIPPPQVVTALALFSTLLVMTPTIERIHTEAIKPYQVGKIRDYDTLWNAAKQPIRDFMFNQIEATGNWSSVYSILDFRGVDTSQPEKLTRADVDMVTLVPAFILSELKVAFLMGFKVFLPFLVIDMVVSTMLISMGMMMLPPVLISLPFKILMFILVDGWALVVGSLMAQLSAGAR